MFTCDRVFLKSLTSRFTIIFLSLFIGGLLTLLPSIAIASAGLTLNISIIHPTACGTADGSIEINVTGGSGSYEYSLDGSTGWTNNNMFTGLLGGSYRVAARNDDASCETPAETYIVLNTQATLLQPGDALLSCRFSGNAGGEVLVIIKVQPFYDLHQNGVVSTNVSNIIPAPDVSKTKWARSEMGGEIFSISIDPVNLDIYTGITSLYGVRPSSVISSNLLKVDGVSGAVSTIATIPGNHGFAGIEYDHIHKQLFATHLEDGKIYRVDPNTGTVLGSFDPLTPDTGDVAPAELGERICAVTYNTSENRVYYSIWANDYISNGMDNTIRSVALDGTGAFLPGSDQLEITQPNTLTRPYSMPVLDIEFNAAETSLLLAEATYITSATTGRSNKSAHVARVLRYDGGTSAWILDNTPTAGNANQKYEIGTHGDKLNSVGGVDWAYGGLDSNGSTQNEEDFILIGGDALCGLMCYGLQYTPEAGGNAGMSVLYDVDNDTASQDKAIYGDVDVILGECMILPVELLSFDATIDACEMIELDWKTASEENFSHFELERSEDGKTFQKIASIQGQGYSVQQQHYTYQDKLQLHTTYYRLKQVDFDGQNTYSKTIVLKSNCFSMQQLVVSPNPVQQTQPLVLDVALPHHTVAQVQVFSTTGQLMQEQNYTLRKGQNQLALTVDALPLGAYFLVIKSEQGQSESARFVVID